MKTSCTFIILSAATLLTSCASGQRGLTLNPVGPPSVQASTPSDNGTLMVFSAFQVTAVSQGDYEHRRHYSDYKIFSEKSKLLQVVHNDSNTVLREAARVTLSPGMYRVVAQANGYGLVTVPVVIERGQVTTVHLEGGGSWENEVTRNQTDLVRLPDGRIVGWRAPQTAP
jgi:hypothetical protein